MEDAAVGRLWIVVVLAAVAAACAAGAAYSTWRVHGLGVQASWLRDRGQAEGESYVETLSSEYAAAQRSTYDRRLALVSETARWRRHQMVSLIGAVFFAFAAYVVRAIRSIRSMEEEMPQGAEKQPEKAATG